MEERVASSGWEDYVRQAVPAETGPPAQPQCGAPLLPPALPPRTRRGFFSPFFVADAHDNRVSVPQHAIVRNHCQGPLRPPGGVCIWPQSRDLPHVRDVVVLAVRDAVGNAQYGWYVREHAESYRLVRLPTFAVERLWRYVRQTPALRRSLLNEQLVDSAFTLPTIGDFHAAALLQFRRTQSVVSAFFQRTRSVAKRKRSEAAPASPARTVVLGACTVCLDDDVELSDRNCCGSQGATCFDCSQKLRGLCPVCDRGGLNAAYQCSVCNAECALGDFGFPCITCQQCTLCNNCYHQCAECAECDPVRLSDEAACIY